METGLLALIDARRPVVLGRGVCQMGRRREYPRRAAL
jgi:hypothetical protein